MNKINKNEQGFTVVEVLLVILTLAIVGGAGYLVAKHVYKNKTVPSTIATAPAKPATPTTPNPYAGWKTDTLTYEKITFQYPSNWTLKDNSQTMAEANQTLAPVNCTLNNGSDNVTLTSPDGPSVSLETGVECRSGLGYQTFSTFSPIKVLGSNYYLGFETASNSVVTSVAVTTQNSNNSTAGDNYLVYPESKNITSSNKPLNLLTYNPILATSEPPQGLTTFQLESSSDFSTAKLILESFKYN